MSKSGSRATARAIVRTAEGGSSSAMLMISWKLRSSSPSTEARPASATLETWARLAMGRSAPRSGGSRGSYRRSGPRVGARRPVWRSGDATRSGRPWRSKTARAPDATIASTTSFTLHPAASLMRLTWSSGNWSPSKCRPEPTRRAKREPRALNGPRNARPGNVEHPVRAPRTGGEREAAGRSRPPSGPSPSDRRERADHLDVLGNVGPQPCRRPRRAVGRLGGSTETTRRRQPRRHRSPAPGPRDRRSPARSPRSRPRRPGRGGRVSPGTGARVGRPP